MISNREPISELNDLLKSMKNVLLHPKGCFQYTEVLCTSFQKFASILRLANYPITHDLSENVRTCFETILEIARVSLQNNPGLASQLMINSYIFSVHLHQCNFLIREDKNKHDIEDNFKTACQIIGNPIFIENYIKKNNYHKFSFLAQMSLDFCNLLNKIDTKMSFDYYKNVQQIYKNATNITWPKSSLLRKFKNKYDEIEAIKKKIAPQVSKQQMAEYVKRTESVYSDIALIKQTISDNLKLIADFNLSDELNIGELAHSTLNLIEEVNCLTSQTLIQATISPNNLKLINESIETLAKLMDIISLKVAKEITGTDHLVVPDNVTIEELRSINKSTDVDEVKHAIFTLFSRSPNVDGKTVAVQSLSRPASPCGGISS